MARSLDAAGRRMWTERLQRFSRSSLTVAAFCQAERVSIPSFYQWRRKLAAQDQANGQPQRSVLPQRGSAAARPARPVFLPVQISAVPAAQIEIHLPNGTRISLPAGDVPTLGAAIAAAGQAPARAAAQNRLLREDPTC